MGNRAPGGYRMNAIDKLEQDGEEVTIRKAKWKLFGGCVMALLGFAVLLVGAILDVQETWMIVVLVAAFFCLRYCSTDSDNQGNARTGDFGH